MYIKWENAPKRTKEWKRYRVILEIDTPYSYENFRQFWEAYSKQELTKPMGELVYLAIEIESDPAAAAGFKENIGGDYR
jgi:hypothetical protein